MRFNRDELVADGATRLERKQAAAPAPAPEPAKPAADAISDAELQMAMLRHLVAAITAMRDTPPTVVVESIQQTVAPPKRRGWRIKVKRDADGLAQFYDILPID